MASPALDKIASLANIRAVITTKWETSYTRRAIAQVESFYVDSSLDNDADSWQITLGDPAGEYLAMMNRDSEVRVELISADPGGAGHIMTGIADDLVYDQDGAYTISGRDYASLALDSVAEPQRWKRVKAMYVIANQARKLGFPEISTNHTSEYKKVIKTDGSETFWEFWYRLVRNDKAYLWVGPNGALILNKLAYDQPNAYYFGTAMATDNPIVQEMHIPVEGLEIRKSVQGRVYSVWVYVNSGKFRITTNVHDGSIGDWIRRPTKILQDSQSHTVQGAKKKGWLEIYEGKVGAVEVKLVISDPTFVIQPNRMCRVRIPEIDFLGQYFIVGTKVQAGPDGYVQEIRLREKEMALSRRVPAEPRIPHPTKKAPVLNTSDNQEQAQATEQYISQICPRAEWSDFYWKAAQEHAGLEWDFDIFLSFLLAIGKHETDFHNYRQFIGLGHEHIEWYAWTPTSSPGERGKAEDPTWGDPSAGLIGQAAAARQMYELSFCNNAGTHGLSTDYGVGPMQLTSRNLKENADDLYTKKVGSGASHGHNEYMGGRWDPESNIMEAARYFREALDDTHMHPDDDAGQIVAMTWAASKYHWGFSSSKASPTDPDAISRKNTALKFLGSIRATIDAIKTSQVQDVDKSTDAGTQSTIFPLGFPTEPQCLAAFQQSEWLGPASASGAVFDQPVYIPKIQLLWGKGFSPGRDAEIRWIVIHTMEVPPPEKPDAEVDGIAEGTASAMASGKNPYAVHYCLDNKEIYQCVHDSDTGFGTAGRVTFGSNLSTNSYSLHFEHAGTAAQSSGQWADAYSQAMLRYSARLTAKKADELGIPKVHLSVADIQAGAAGFAGHIDINNAFKDAPINSGADMSHWDPGPNFPWTQYMSWVNGGP